MVFVLRERGLLIVKSTLDICTSSGQCSAALCDRSPHRLHSLVTHDSNSSLLQRHSYGLQCRFHRRVQWCFFVSFDSTVAGRNGRMMDEASTPFYTGPSTFTVFSARVLRIFLWVYWVFVLRLFRHRPGSSGACVALSSPQTGLPFFHFELFQCPKGCGLSRCNCRRPYLSDETTSGTG